MIAVLDVGKTNKKAYLFDRNLQRVDERIQSFPEREKQGFLQEDPEGVLAWFLECLRDFGRNGVIRAVSVSTHGAMAVCLDGQGEFSCPPLAYNNQTGQEFQDDFYHRFGSARDLQESLATVPVGELANAGKLIYFLQRHFPREFQRTRQILFYPQYFGYKLTGNVGCDICSLGSHSYLYDPRQRTYSLLARQMGISWLLPPRIGLPWQVLGHLRPDLLQRIGQKEPCVVTLGCHDSNAALLPYLLNSDRDFILNSTGTWCVIMHPEHDIEFKPRQLGKTIYYNHNALNGEPVKTALFLGGHEWEAWNKVLDGLGLDGGREVSGEDLRQIVGRKNIFITPSTVKGTGLFPHCRPYLYVDEHKFGYFELERQDPAALPSPARIRAALVASLACQTAIAFNELNFSETGLVYVDGGLSGNEAYLGLLASAYGRGRVLANHFQHNTALGAAICGKAAWMGVNPSELPGGVTLELSEVQPVPGMEFDGYAGRFAKLCKG